VSQTPGRGRGEPGGIRASDAERDATVERLRDAAGEGRLTLEEFSDRMEQASTAKTRAELDQLLTDLPAGNDPGHTGTAGSAVAVGGSGSPSWHVSPIGGLNVSGPWRMGRHLVVISLIGGARLDLSQAELAARDVTLTKISVIGGVRARIPLGIRVDVSGVSLLGGTDVENAPDPGPGAPTIHIRAFSVIGGIRVRRGGRRPRGGRTSSRSSVQGGGGGWDERSGRDRNLPPLDDRLDHKDDERAFKDERRAWKDQRHAERHARHDERRRERRGY
jgi:Domain of unknown function (DUF1707)